MKANKKYPWLVVALLWLVALLNYMDRQMLATMRPSMQVDIVELQWATSFGQLMAIFLWIYGFMSPVAGVVADKTSRKWMIVGSLFVWSAVTFSMGYATNFQQLYALRAIMGVSEAFYIPAGLSLIADYHKGPSRSLAIGIHMTGIYAGQALGGFGATIAHAYTWHTTFHTLGLAGIVYALVLLLLLYDKEQLPEENQEVNTKRSSLFGGLKVLFSNFSFWVILLYFTVPSLPGWAIKNWLPTLFADKLQIPMAEAGPIATVSTAASSFLGVLLGGLLSDRWVKIRLKGRIFTGVIGLLLMVPALFLLATGSTLLHVLAAAICFGVGFGMFDANNMPILCQFVSSKHRATAYGLMNMMGVFFGAYITDFLGKSVDEGSLDKSFAMLAIMLLLVCFLQLLLLRPRVDDFED
ncbi:MFS transporter [Olivibacter sp. SDN3]|nr:MFS transporter [Olivibacter sp. SDN3]